MQLISIFLYMKNMFPFMTMYSFDQFDEKINHMKFQSLNFLKERVTREMVPF